MLCEADIKVSWRARPRGFVALMSLYESNYLRFLHLAGDPTRLHGTLTSRIDGDCELRLAVLEHMPYTSTLALTYLLPSGNGDGLERLPDLKLRAYHDARLLEADQLRQQPAHQSVQQPARQPVEQSVRQASKGHNARRQDPQKQDPLKVERELHQRWTRNMMLNKWLEYCVERGHRFTI
jgi:uncharacterized protein YqiB (DUF1249 family)